MTAEVPPLDFEVPVGERLIGRAWSWKKDPLERSALKDFAARQAQADEDGTAPPTDYRVSVFAVPREAHETMRQLIARLIKTTGDGLNSDNITWLGVVTETELEEADFSLDLSEPPPHHYDIVLGQEPENLRSQALSDLFYTHERIRVQSWTV